MSSALLSTDRSTAPATSTVPAKVADDRPYLAAVPDCEPPFDDERSAASRLQQLRLAGQSRAGATAARTLEDPLVRPRPGQRTIGLVRVPDTIADSRVPGWSQEVDIGVRRTTTAELPPATRSVRYSPGPWSKCSAGSDRCRNCECTARRRCSPDCRADP